MYVQFTSCVQRVIENQQEEAVYVTIRNSAFFLALYLTGVHFRRELQHVGDVSKQKIMCRPIRTREIGGVTLTHVLYGNIRNRTANRMQVVNSKYEVPCHLYLETHFVSAEKGKKLSSIYNKKSLGWFNQFTAVFTA